MPKKPTTTAADQLLAAMTEAGMGGGEPATVVMEGGSYTGPLTVQWADDAGTPLIVSVTIEVGDDGRKVLIPWHAVRAIEPAPDED